MPRGIFRVYEVLSLVSLSTMTLDYIVVWATGWLSGVWSFAFVMNSNGEGVPELFLLCLPLPWLVYRFVRFFGALLR